MSDLLNVFYVYCKNTLFVSVSRLGTIRQEHDANCTYEGESNVLIQQCSNWLLNQYAGFLKGRPISSPLDTAKFLENIEYILGLKFNHHTIDETLRPESKKFFYEKLSKKYLEQYFYK